MKYVRVYTPPLNWDNSVYTINGELPVNLFLAGTIDNGDSEDWQQELIDTISGVELKKPVMVYNPRRKDWPSSSDHSEVHKQIDWELYHLERANLIVMNILADSKSPVSLMELGLFAREGKLIVFCPKTFYRYDNVLKVCEHYDVPLYTTNNIPYIAEKVCNCIGIDKEAQEKAKEDELIKEFESE